MLLTGIHLMRSGVVEANLLTLNAEYKLPCVGELVARKAGPEQGALPDADAAFHCGEYERLVTRLREEHERSALPEVAAAKNGLSDLLVRLRLKTLSMS